MTTVLMNSISLKLLQLILLFQLCCELLGLHASGEKVPGCLSLHLRLSAHPPVSWPPQEFYLAGSWDRNNNNLPDGQ